MIEFSENTRGIWFVELDSANWLAHVEATKAGFKFQCRFRYFKDEKVWDSDDPTSWYHCEGEDLAKAMTVMGETAHMIAKAQDGKVWELLRGKGSIDEFMEEFKKLPFAHATQLKPGESA